MSDNTPVVVKLEFERVQTFLFEGSRLKTMIGANTLLGEVLRGRLQNQAFQATDANTVNLPVLAGMAKPPGNIDWNLLKLPGRDPGDPLGGTDTDDPGTSYQKGILARDGGHFHAVFPDLKEAENFIRAAEETLAGMLPGILLDIKKIPLKWDQGENKWTASKALEDDHPHRGEAFLDLPQQQLCRVTGQGPAATTERDPDNNEEGQPISAAVKAKHKAATRFDQSHSHDIVGLLKDAVLEGLNKNNLTFPNQFEEVAKDSNYLAVIAADGNGIGQRSKKWREQIATDGNNIGRRSKKRRGQSAKNKDFFKREARGECFFHSMRVAVRKALVAALTDVFHPVAQQLPLDRKLPFRLLMQGGDDLLLVCNAAYAFPFVVAYAQRLEEQPLIDKAKIHVGTGVAVVKKTFPFHRAHALAEQLASSAKRLYRTLKPGEQGSVVDWLAISEAWHDEIRDVRGNDAVRRLVVGDKEETLLLSRKPYRILSQDTDRPRADSLEDLLAQAYLATGGAGILFDKELHRLNFVWPGGNSGVPRAARSQLIALAEAVTQGRVQAEWAVLLLPPEVRSHLVPGILQDPGDKKMIRWTPWHSSGGNTWSTTYLDFLELYDLERQRRLAWERTR